GQSTFRYRSDEQRISAGSLVLINPDWVHACNPIGNRPWAYLMLYVDVAWLTALRYEAGLLPALRWQDISTAVLSDPAWHAGYLRLAACLTDPGRYLLDKQKQVVVYLSTLLHVPDGQESPSDPTAPVI